MNNCAETEIDSVARCVDPGKQRNLRVLHVVRGMANASGLTHVVAPLAKEQARQGLDVSVFYVERNNQLALVPDSRLVGSRCFALTLPYDSPGISLSFASALRREIRTFDVVHIHSVWNFPTYYTMRTALSANVPYVVAPHGSFEPWALAQRRWRKRVYGWATEIPLLQRAACIHALTEKEVAQLRDYGIRAPCAIIPNGVATDWLAKNVPPLSIQLGLASSERTLLFLSRLHPKKGLDYLIKAFALAKTPKLTLVIAGHDAGSGYEAELRRLVDECGIASRCIFVGELRGDSKFLALLGTDAFALTSHSEGIPLAVIEAMAAARPVIVTPGCNIPEAAERGAGLMVPVEPEAIARAIDRVFDNPDTCLRMGREGRALVEERFTWTRIASEVLSVYRTLTLRHLTRERAEPYQ